MNPVWLFEADVFGESAEAIKTEIRRRGLACYTTRQTLLASGVGDIFSGRRLAEDACVIACGSYPFVHYIQANRRWVPGSWCKPENLACSAYYPHFQSYLLNQRHTILTGVEALQKQNMLFAALSHGGHVFIRPDGCQKVFTGRLVAEDDFARALGPARYDPDTRIVVAPPRTIQREWRLIVAEGTVIAESQYLERGTITVRPGCPEEVRQYVAAMLADIAWRPDELFMLDVCEADDQFHLLELNGFSCAAFYQCAPAIVVRTATALAIRAWEARQIMAPSAGCNTDSPPCARTAGPH